MTVNLVNPYTYGAKGYLGIPGQNSFGGHPWNGSVRLKTGWLCGRAVLLQTRRRRHMYKVLSRPRQFAR